MDLMCSTSRFPPPASLPIPSLWVIPVQLREFYYPVEDNVTKSFFLIGKKKDRNILKAAFKLFSQ